MLLVRPVIVSFALLTLLVACGGDQASDSDLTTQRVQQNTEKVVGSAQDPGSRAKADPGHIAQVTSAVDDARLEASANDHANWLTYGLSYLEQRYSELTQINKKNLQELGLAWTIQLDSTRGIQSTPIVVDGIMYLTGPWNEVYAIDTRRGEIIWEYDAAPPREIAPYLCCGVVNRGVALYKGLVIFGTLDGRLVALDAVNGELKWSTDTLPEGSQMSITGAPRIAKGKVLIGNAGAEIWGARGHVSAYDALTGKFIWRFYTVPGDPSKSQENEALEMAEKTWTGEWWKQGGGGTVWDAIVYDPELDLVYVGVGNGTHWNREIRSPDGGDNLFLSSIVALRPDDGSYVWHYQTTPGDSWDYTATQPIALAELEIDGKQRKVLMQAPKNGFFYVIDRETGELISGKPFSYVNWAKGLDENGRPIEAEGARYTDGKNHWITPSSHGAHNWFPMSFSPSTGMVYIPGVRMSGGYSANSLDPQYGYHVAASMATKLYNDTVYDTHPEAIAPGHRSGELIAYDPVKQERVWAIPQPSIYNGGLLTTAADLLMQGDAEGNFSIRDAVSGDILWQFDVRNGALSPPITYMVDGEQYITLAVEWGGGRGQGSKLVDRLYPGTIYTFKLGGTAKAPAKEPAPERPLTTLKDNATDEQIGAGYNVYVANCIGCHTFVGKGGGAIPDLARSTDGIYDLYGPILQQGIFAAMGMPIHDHLSDEDIANLKSFIFWTAEMERQGISSSEYYKALAIKQMKADKVEVDDKVKKLKAGAQGF